MWCIFNAVLWPESTRHIYVTRILVAPHHNPIGWAYGSWTYERKVADKWGTTLSKTHLLAECDAWPTSATTSSGNAGAPFVIAIDFSPFYPFLVTDELWSFKCLTLSNSPATLIKVTLLWHSFRAIQMSCLLLSAISPFRVFRMKYPGVVALAFK